MPTAPAKVTAAAVIKIAAHEIGEREGRNNDNKYGREYGVNNTAWCAQFIWWCANEAGADDGQFFPKTAWCPTLLAYARKNGLIIRDPYKGDETGTPRAGDIGLVQRLPSEDRNYGNGAKHVFFVEKYLGDGYVQTIEGNTSTTGSASGNGVYRLKRKLTDRIVIFRPKWDEPPPPRPKMITINGKQYEDISRVRVHWINDRRKSGEFSRHIYYLQTWLSKISKDYGVKADGVWDKDTQAALDEFRRERVKINGKLLKGDDARGGIGLTSLKAARDQAKSNKKVAE